MEKSRDWKSGNEEPRFIDIMLDDWFKRSFGEERNKRLLLALLNLLLPDKEIEDVTYMGTEHVSPLPGNKNVRIDVECVSKDGSRFMVEMQKEQQDYFAERMLYYSTFAVQKQENHGQDTYWFMPVYVIGLMNFRLHDEPGTVEYRYRLQREGSDEVMTNRLTYIFIELPNHRSMDDPAATRLDRFCYYLRSMASLRTRPDSNGDELIELLLDSADFTKFTPEERVKYQYEMTTERDRRNQETFKINKAREEERAKRNMEIAENLQALGMNAEFIEKAIGKSEEEVRAKHQNEITTERDRRNQETFKINKALAEERTRRNMEIAKNMLALGISVELIEKSTGLSEDTIKDLQ